LKKLFSLLVVALICSTAFFALTGADYAVKIFADGEDTGYGVVFADLNNEYNYMLQYYASQEGFDPIFDGLFVKYDVAGYKAQRALFDYYAYKENITADQLKVEEEANKVVQQLLSQEGQEEAIKSQYGSVENFYKFVVSVYRKEMTRDEVMGIIANVTSADLKDFFEKNKEAINERLEKVSAKHILVDTQELAEEIKAKILNGEITFEDAAKEYSTCPSNAEGGDLKEFGRKQMVQTFEAAAFSAPLNEVMGPVKTDFGYHLITVYDHYVVDTFEKYQETDEFAKLAEDLKTQKMQTWIQDYMLKNNISFKFFGILSDIEQFSLLYQDSVSTQSLAELVEFMRTYVPNGEDGHIFVEVALSSILSIVQQNPDALDAETTAKMTELRKKNLEALSNFEDASLGALSRLYGMDPEDTRIGVKFFGKYIDQAILIATEDKEFFEKNKTAIVSQLKQAVPQLEKIALNETADSRDRVIAYMYLIRINNLADEKEQNQAIADRILELDPENSEVLELIK